MILLNQVGYIDKMAQRFGIKASSSPLTPLEHSLPLVKPTANDKRADPTLYKEFMGSLNHLAIFTRPDISLAVSKLSQFNQDANLTHLNAARRTLEYANSTKHYTLKYKYGSGAIQIDGYADADWGSDLTQRKSTSGYVFTMNGSPISWTSKKQTTVALSTMEAEYMALSDASRELLAHLTFFTSVSLRIAIRLCTRTTKQQSLSSNANPIISGQSTSISDTTLYEITTNAELSISNTFPQINNSPMSSRNHFLASNTRTSSMRCVSIKKGFSVHGAIPGQPAMAPVRDFLPFRCAHLHQRFRVYNVYKHYADIIIFKGGNVGNQLIIGSPPDHRIHITAPSCTCSSDRLETRSCRIRVYMGHCVPR
jgi:hypothetical protein